MIEWMREKLSKIVSGLFVITVIVSSISGSIIGYSLFDFIGCIIGILIGFLVGTFLGIITFGFLATVINISVTCDKINSKLETIGIMITNSNSLLDSLTFSDSGPNEKKVGQNNKIIEKVKITDSESTLTDVRDSCSKESHINNEASSQKKSDYVNNKIRDGYIIIEKDGKKFAIKRNENADIYFCPNCYVQVSSSLDTCFRCLKRFDSM